MGSSLEIGFYCRQIVFWTVREKEELIEQSETGPWEGRDRGRGPVAGGFALG